MLTANETAYATLLYEESPERIGSMEQYSRTVRRLGDLVRKGRRRSKEETKLMRLLSLLVEDYDRRHILPPDDSSPAEMLQFLLEQSGKMPANLMPIFGQRSHVNEAINGKRPISAEQARRLGKLFHVKPGLFI